LIRAIRDQRFQTLEKAGGRRTKQFAVSANSLTLPAHFLRGGFMGQAKKNRAVCPVTKNQIQPAECGTNRISSYACPECCPQNPWSAENYDRQLEIYDRMNERCCSRLKEEASRAGQLLTLPSAEPGSEIPLMLFFFNRFFRERDEQGKTFFERWKAEHFIGLNNDQAVLFEAQASFFPAVLEVQQIADDRRVTAIDRLNPERGPMLLVDRSLAARACRFSTFLAFPYKTPCFYRMQSVAIPLPELPGMEAEDIVLEIVRHFNGPVKNRENLSDWIVENFQLIADSLKAVKTARQAAMFRTMDAAYTKSVYKLNGTPAAFIKIMENHPDIHTEAPSGEEADEGFIRRWVWTIEGSTFGVGRTVLCTIMLHEENYVRLETSAAKRREQAKPLFEQLLGKKISFTGERTDDLALQTMYGRKLFYDQTLVPAKLLENTTEIDTSQTCLPKELTGLSRRELMRRTREAFLHDFIDSPLPALDGKTPRQASADKSLRPALLRLMKKHVHSNDKSDMEQGVQTDINSLLKELKLDEIIFLPPPLRTAPYDDSREFEDENEDWDEDGIALTPDEIESGVASLKTLNQEQLADDFMSAFPEAYAFFQEGLFDQKPGVQKRFQPQILTLAAQTAFLFFPPGLPGPFITVEYLFGSLGLVMDAALADQEEPPEIFAKQPHVMYFVINGLKEIFGKRKSRDETNVTLFFAAFVNELHEALYEREFPES
jgi:hypothetical protein